MINKNFIVTISNREKTKYTHTYKELLKHNRFFSKKKNIFTCFCYDQWKEMYCMWEGVYFWFVFWGCVCVGGIVLGKGAFWGRICVILQTWSKVCVQFGSVLGFSKNENFKFQNHKKCKHRILKIWIFHYEVLFGECNKCTCSFN